MSDQTVHLGNRTVTLPRSYMDRLDRVKELKQAREQTFPDQYRTAQVLNGGQDAVLALTNGKQVGDEFRDMPIANYLRDALDALASRMGAVPELRVEPPSTGRKSDESDTKLRAAEKRARIVAGYDEANRLPEALPQVARWVPGAAYCVATIDPVTVNGEPYPKVTYHYPLDTMLSQWTPLQDPVDCGFITRVPARELRHQYPEHAHRFTGEREAMGGVLLDGRQTYQRGIEVVSYYDLHGTWWFAPELALLLDFVPNPLESGPAFEAYVKFNYSRLRGEYDDLIGLMVSMARLNILAEIAVKDDVFSPTNIFGGPPHTGDYKKGRATNIFDANARVEIPQRTVQHQAWQQLDRLERQLNIEGTITQQDRGESPMSFVTGRGMAQLGERTQRQVAEYQTVFSSTGRRLDGKQLEYDELSWPDRKKPVLGSEELYVPSRDIKGRYRTTREYGVMAGVEEATKMNGLAIMDSAGWVSKRWVRGQISGLGNVAELEEQLRSEGAEQAVLEMILVHANNPESPEHMRAFQAAIDMLPGGEVKRIAEKWMTERGEELEAAEAEMVGGMGGPPAAPPDPTAVLSRLTAGGEARGGVQTMGRLQG